jgi:hypothetical protein
MIAIVQSAGVLVVWTTMLGASRMFNRLDPYITSAAICYKPVDELFAEDFRYFDKDGFELNIAEQKYYSAMNFPIHYPILNHTCWQVPWYDCVPTDHGLFLDHAMLLQRCLYSGQAKEQLQSLIKVIPLAQSLLQIKPKWGYDFDLNAVNDQGEVYEVLHVENDSTNYDAFCERRIIFEQIVKRTDWVDVAKQVWNRREEWQHLKGFDQNHWKANFVLGWDRSEYLEKTI